MEDEYIFDEDEGIEKDMKSRNQEPVSWQARVQLNSISLLSNPYDVSHYATASIVLNVLEAVCLNIYFSASNRQNV